MNNSCAEIGCFFILCITIFLKIKVTPLTLQLKNAIKHIKFHIYYLGFL